jgi:serine/threonine-protein kinase RsbW
MYRELEINSTMDNLIIVEKFVEEICDAYYIFNSYYGNILLAVEEAVKNAIIHGNGNVVSKNVKIIFSSKDNELCFTIEDEGEGFDLASVPNPLEVDDTIADKVGKGLFLIRRLADKVKFNRSGNSVEMTFNISNINQETTITRISKLHSYFQTQKSKV